MDDGMREDLCVKDTYSMLMRKLMDNSGFIEMKVVKVILGNAHSHVFDKPIRISFRKVDIRSILDMPGVANEDSKEGESNED